MTLQEFPQGRRPLDVAVISDSHLGMRGCRAAEVLSYLRSIDLEILVLNIGQHRHSQWVRPCGVWTH